MRIFYTRTDSGGSLRIDIDLPHQLSYEVRGEPIMLLYRDYVVVDQGGHTECESLAAFSKLWPKLTNGGRITLRIYQVLKHVAILNQPIPSSTIIDDPSHQPCVPTAECYPTLLLTHCCCILSHISEQEKEKWQMKIFGQSLAHH